MKLKTIQKFIVTSPDVKSTDVKERNIFFENIQQNYSLDKQEYIVTFRKYYEDLQEVEVAEVIDGVIIGNTVTEEKAVKTYLKSEPNIVTVEEYRAVENIIRQMHPDTTDATDFNNLMLTEGIMWFIISQEFYQGQLKSIDDFEIINS